MLAMRGVSRSGSVNAESESGRFMTVPFAADALSAQGRALPAPVGGRSASFVLDLPVQQVSICIPLPSTPAVASMCGGNRSWLKRTFSSNLNQRPLSGYRSTSLHVWDWRKADLSVDLASHYVRDCRKKSRAFCGAKRGGRISVAQDFRSNIICLAAKDGNLPLIRL